MSVKKSIGFEPSDGVRFIAWACWDELDDGRVAERTSSVVDLDEFRTKAKTERIGAGRPASRQAVPEG